MARVAEFEKISFNQWVADCAGISLDPSGNSAITPHSVYNEIAIPERSTAQSAGYDFKIPYSVVIPANSTVKVLTGLRVKMNPDNVLLVFPRSSIGIKYGIGFANTIPVIDADYYYAKNQGHMMFFLKNNSDSSVSLNAGDKICQGILTSYGITYSDNASGIRTGGFGSTGK